SSSTARANLGVDPAGTDNSTDVTVTGEDYLSLTGQQITANAINPDNLASADFGDFSCNGTTCSFDANTVGDNEIDFTNVTLADFTNDANFITDGNTNWDNSYNLFDIDTNDTDDITEGTTKLFFTSERTDDRVAALIQNGTGISWTYNDGSNTLTPTIALGTAIEKGELANSGTLSFDWTDSEVADSLTIGASGSVNDGALSANVSLLGSSIDISDETNLQGDTEIVLTGDTLSLASTITRDTEINTESALETFLTDVANVFTDNDGALSDDDLSDNSTSDLAEGTNLYFTNTRARSAISETVTGLDYATSTGVFSLTSGYSIPLTASSTNWNTAF